jgi:hypothetical protein
MPEDSARADVGSITCEVIDQRKRRAHGAGHRQRDTKGDHAMQRLTFLRFALLADAIASGATGALAFAGAGILAELLGLPTALLRYAGLSLFPYVAIVAYVGTRATISRPAVWAIIAYNMLWAIDSVTLLASGYVSPTALGYAFVILQAAAVAGLGMLQYIGLRRSAVTA